MKKTPWFPGIVKPHHRGVYERRVGVDGWYSFWTGARWCFIGANPLDAYQRRSHGSVFQKAPWRGLAEKP